MGKTILEKVVSEGVPLIDITVRFVRGIDYQKATEEFNKLGEDIDLYPENWYNEERLRVGSATAEALFRLFGWKNIRVPLVLQNSETRKFEETEYYCWKEIEPRSIMPKEIDGLVESISYSQPGADDDGQWYEPKFD